MTSDDNIREITIGLPTKAFNLMRLAARKRDTRVERLVSEIVTLVAEDDLVGAVLDKEEEPI